MEKYRKAIAAVVTSVLGLGVTYGLLDEAQAQNLGIMATAAVNLLAVYAVPNK